MLSEQDYAWITMGTTLTMRIPLIISIQDYTLDYKLSQYTTFELTDIRNIMTVYIRYQFIQAQRRDELLMDT